MTSLRARNRRSAVVVTSAALLLAVLSPYAGAASSSRARPAPAAAAADWSAYLDSAAHSSANPAAVAITTTTARSLVQRWHWSPAKATQAGQITGLYSSPVVSGGRVFVGARTGVFSALNQSTGAVLWSRSLGFVTNTTCGAEGFTSTATVAADPVSGAATVYVAAADGYLYALNATTGATRWRAVVGIPSTTVNDYYDWGSPTVSGGVVYMGISSQCDNPLVRGGVRAVDQATGAALGTYFSTPAGTRGASVWSSVLVTTDGRIFVTTGNGPAGSDRQSIVQLSLNRTAHTLTRVAKWMVPKVPQNPDSDFGGSPTQFTAVLGGVPTTMVGACNKNGVYYAFRESSIASGPVWTRTVGAAYRSGVGQCDAAAAWDGTRLIVAGNSTTIGGVAYQGSVRRLDPATGAVLWSHGLPGPAIGSPSLDGAGVLSVGAFGGTQGPFLLNANTGALLWTVPFTNGKTFAQSPFTTNGMYLATSQNQGIRAYSP
jgi:polyvinyl alcohol dehydrogenase (cytochrome)